MKLWLYQFYVLARISWPFMVQDLPLSFAEALERKVRAQLKRWAGLFKYADVGSLFRSKSKFGLGLTSVTTHFVKMQVIKCSLLKHSGDPDIRTLGGVRVNNETDGFPINLEFRVKSTVFR